MLANWLHFSGVKGNGVMIKKPYPYARAFVTFFSRVDFFYIFVYDTK
jgi:hypothetical protein